MPDLDLTEDERKCLDLLGQAWGVFAELPVLHHADRVEFSQAIHAAQNIVYARLGLRLEGIVRLEPDQRTYERPPG